MEFQPDLSALPAAQRALWDQLDAVPNHFALYGGTAIALRLGHRSSLDFDFMSEKAFSIGDLNQEIPWMKSAERLQCSTDTLTVAVGEDSPVLVSFFGNIRFGRVGTPDRAQGNGVWVASLLDLAATKMAVIQQRAEAKDYLDVFALIEAGVTLESALAAARALYQQQFNPGLTLKALAYYDDGDLGTVPDQVRQRLTSAAVRVGDLPQMDRVSESLSPSTG